MLQISIFTSHFEDMFSVLPSLYVNNSTGSKIIILIHSNVSTAGETSVALPLGGQGDIEWKRTLTEYTKHQLKQT